ncbi:MAG: DUF6055 domain-containing protein [Campylobacterota bacterium]|nr:DUF6055 domain-containing protein [Campylobacterota bacterium]
MWFFLFFSSSLYSYSLDRILLRDITSENTLQTEHFHIYWSDEYEYTYPWLVDVDGYPMYIDTLKTQAEDIYQSFIDEGFVLPDRIEIYVANTGIFANGLYTNSISSLGAFTSDDYPEILINANIAQKTLDSDIKRILAHEMMHVVQYQNDIILGENTTPDSLKWFTEGTAVVSETYITNDPKYLYEYFESIINIQGFKDTKGLTPYGNGFLFYYLMKKYNYSLIDFINKYKLYSTFDIFIANIEQEQNLNKHQLISDIYHSFLNDKEFYGVGFEEIYIGYSLYENYTLNLTSSWQLISLRFNTNDFSFLDDIDYLMWGYKNNSWSCISNNENLNTKCNDNYTMIDSISTNDGIWIYTDKNSSLNLHIFK